MSMATVLSLYVVTEKCHFPGIVFNYNLQLIMEDDIILYEFVFKLTVAFEPHLLFKTTLKEMALRNDT